MATFIATKKPHSIDLLMNQFIRLQILMIAVCCSCGAETGTWTPAANMNEVRLYATCTRLGDELGAKVLVAGGTGATRSAELYDPSENQWSYSGLMKTVRHLHSATRLSDGKVLVAGGVGGTFVGENSTRKNSAEVYDPATETWSYVASMTHARREHTATLLADGRVLVVGGTGNENDFVYTAETYNPVTNSWTPAGDLTAIYYENGRGKHNATLMGNGKVLVSGGSNQDYNSVLEIFDPATGSWTVSSGYSGLDRFDHTSTLLADGNLLLAGGGGFTANAFGPPRNDSMYYPSLDTTFGGGVMNNERKFHSATRTSRDRILVAGGLSWASPHGRLGNAEIFEPLLRQWVDAGNMNVPRDCHVACSLDDGKVLVVAGDVGGGSGTKSAEIFTPTAIPTMPTVSSQPTSISVVVGSPVSFSVVASGTAPITYQWQMSQTGVTGHYGNLSGATSSTFDYPDPAELYLNDTYYRCVIIDATGVVISSEVARLNVTESSGANPPVISQSRAIQVPGAHEIQLTFDLEEPDGEACDITLSASLGGGQGYPLPQSALSGDVQGVVPGVNHTISIDPSQIAGPGLDLRGVFVRDLTFHLTATDSSGNQGSDSSNRCLVDTENPDIDALVDVVEFAKPGEREQNWSGIAPRNRRGLFHSRGLMSSETVQYPPNGVDRPYRLHWLNLLNPVGDGPYWSLSDFESNGEGALFLTNGIRQLSSGYDDDDVYLPLDIVEFPWELSEPGEKMYWKDEEGVVADDKSVFAGSLPQTPGDAEGTVSFYKRFEFPREFNDLSKNASSLSSEETDYRNLDPDAKKLVIVIHGWNRSVEEDPFQGVGFRKLMKALHEDMSARAGGAPDWDLYGYDWSHDGITGNLTGNGVWLPFERDTHENGGCGVAQENGTQAAEIGYQHGLILGKLLFDHYGANLEKVHFIAHSAGTWVARSASLYLKGVVPLDSTHQIEQQITLLDPYNPEVGYVEWTDDWLLGKGGETSPLGTADIDEWAALVDANRMENIYSDDSAVKGTNVRYWSGNDEAVTVSGAIPVVNRKVGTSPSPLYRTKDSWVDWKAHSGPINFYALSVKGDDLGVRAVVNAPSSGKETEDVWSAFPAYAAAAGWQKSLFRQEYDTANQAPGLATIQTGSSWNTNSASSGPNAMRSSTSDSALVRVDNGWVRAMLIPIAGGESAIGGPSQLQADGSFSILLSSDETLTGQFNLGSSPVTLSLWVDGVAFGAVASEAVGSTSYAGGSGSVDGGNLTFSLVLNDGTAGVSVSGAQLDGSAWYGSATGMVDGSGSLFATSGDGFSLSGTLEEGGQLQSSNAVVTPPSGVVVPPSEFQDWIGAHGLTGVGFAGELDDPDRDGVKNIFEFYRGSSPSVPDEEPSLTPVWAEGGSFGIRYWRSNTAEIPGVSFEWSPNLKDWAGDGESIGSVRVDYEFQTVSSTPAARERELIPRVSGGTGNLYLRLVLSRSTTPDGYVKIPAGSFTRKDGSEAIFSRDFYMQSTEVTNSQLVEVMNWALAQGFLEVRPSSVLNADGLTRYLIEGIGEGEGRLLWDDGRLVVVEGFLNHPASNITKFGAAAYCNFLTLKKQSENRRPCYDFSDWSCDLEADGYRLPTEDEWERGARLEASLADQTWRFPWGDFISHNEANYIGYSDLQYALSYEQSVGRHPLFLETWTAPVGSFAASAGLFDMAGNVSEMCQDINTSIGRGGSFLSSAAPCLVYFRSSYNPYVGYADLGFRPVCR